MTESDYTPLPLKPAAAPARSVRLLIAYDGSRYEGWQSQPSGKTIQDTLSSRIAKITGSLPRLSGASRTDAGVHALGQVAVFSTQSAMPPEVMKRALNATLPADIRILQAEETTPAFHPRFDAAKKRYVYIIGLGSDSSAFLHRYCWHHPAALNRTAMKQAAALLVGSHDFSSFRGSGCSAKTTQRQILCIDIEPLDSLPLMTFSLPGSWLSIAIEADAFLRHMVRNIVGTLAEVGRGKIAASEISSILAACDRTKAGPTAPASGLFLEKITY